jgi:hypothetical protein
LKCNVNEKWSIWWKQRLKAFEKEIERRIFKSKEDKVTGEWRKLCNEKIHSFYSSGSIVTGKTYAVKLQSC